MVNHHFSPPFGYFFQASNKQNPSSSRKDTQNQPLLPLGSLLMAKLRDVEKDRNSGFLETMSLWRFACLQICHHKNRHLWVPINNAGKNSKFEVAEWFFQKRKKSVFHDFSSDLVTVFNLHRFVWIKRTNNCCVLHNTWKIWQ